MPPNHPRQFPHKLLYLLPVQVMPQKHTQCDIHALIFQTQPCAIAQQNAPSILLGDFNMTDTYDEYAHISAAGLKDAFKASGKGRGSTLPRRVGPWKRNKWLNGLIRWVPLPPMFRIDYIWHSDHLRSLDCWVGKDAGSDHMPVMAVMAFMEGEGAPT